MTYKNHLNRPIHLACAAAISLMAWGPVAQAQDLPGKGKDVLPCWARWTRRCSRP